MKHYSLRYCVSLLGVRNGFKVYAQEHLARSEFYSLVCEATGDTMWFRPRSTDLSIYKQIYFNKEYQLSCKRPNLFVVDAGANVGLSALYFNHVLERPRIIAIEPEDSNFAALKKNVAPFPNIKPVRAALWHRNTELALVTDSGKQAAFQTRVDETASQQVKAFSVEQIMRDAGVDFIDILKVDIEGSEKEVFDHCESWIDKVGLLIVELHERFRPGATRSLIRATEKFDNEWFIGENHYFCRRKEFLPTHATGAINEHSGAIPAEVASA